MAVTRTVLSRKGLVQAQNNTAWYADADANWSLLDANVAFMADLTATAVSALSKQLLDDLLIEGIISGFGLSVGSGLVPTIAIGVLYANGTRYAPGAPPTLPTMPTSSTRYLYYNSSTGFYYVSAIGATSTGDAFIGTVVSGASTITSVTNATPEGGLVSAAPGAPGNFTLAHNLGKSPRQQPRIHMTSGGAIWFQIPTMFDNQFLYLVASDAGVTAKAEVW